MSEKGSYELCSLDRGGKKLLSFGALCEAAVGEAALRYRFSSTTGNPSFGMISGTCWVGSS